ncbi:ferrochelatase [Gracilimonas sediminicola]|uniref:Ferrochelatase n=1 Tax=Gracilimonas sediminicola TaxID=2952158 RepID=A0A9X2RC63_9BACT|nr:ferrochelatase [Gracilimonas sediminicola]MCP9290710.1 ferrochelatase [Gracilimonas sediminicola]
MAQSNTGILLVNLGSPDSYEPADLKVYLREFLTDKRVIDFPAPIRKTIVEAFILPFRPKESGEAYELIWWDEGSPLIVITQRVIDKLKQRLGDDVPVSMGMRYGNPSIEAGFDELMEKNPNLDRVFLIPLYPQYAMATTETVIEKAKEVWQSKYPNLQVEFKDAFYDDPDYVKALGESIRPYIDEHDIDHLLFSYHGVPERQIKKRDITGDHCLKCEDCCNVNSPAHTFCYRHQDLMTTKNAAEYLDLDSRDFTYSTAFQSKLGIDPWLTPATDAELVRLAEEEGVKKVAVCCPAFISDCIETLEEIGIRGKEDFVEAGGEDLILIPCVNDSDLWIDTLEKWCAEKLKVKKVEAA